MVARTMILWRRTKLRVLRRLVEHGEPWLFGSVLIAEKILSRWSAFVVLGDMESDELIEGRPDSVSGRRCYRITEKGRLGAT